MASIVCLQSSDLIAPLSLHLTYRDDLFPRQEYRHTFDRLLDQLPDRQACKTMVELLALAHDRGCERELAERLADLLDTGELPDIASLRHLFSPARAEMPVVSVHLAPLNGYEALIGTAPAGEGA